MTKRNENKKYKIQLLIKDPKLLTPIETIRRNFTFYFGKFGLTPLKYGSSVLQSSTNDILCNIPSTQLNDLVEIGIKSANTNLDLNSFQRGFALHFFLFKMF